MGMSHTQSKMEHRKNHVNQAWIGETSQTFVKVMEKWEVEAPGIYSRAECSRNSKEETGDPLPFKKNKLRFEKGEERRRRDNTRIRTSWKAKAWSIATAWHGHKNWNGCPLMHVFTRNLAHAPLYTILWYQSQTPTAQTEVGAPYFVLCMSGFELP